MERRKFIRNSISFSLLIGLHKTAQASDLVRKGPKSSNESQSRFKEITLYTSKLEEQFDFYTKTLAFPNITREKTQFSIPIGESILRFKEVLDGSDPFYHYAINIPSNKHEKAKEWLSSKTPLLLDGAGGDLQYFGFWDAHAMYFKDPSGNIGELIARHTMDNDREGEFTSSDLLCVSEIGTPVENSEDFASALHENYGLDKYGDSMFIGDETGLFVAVPIDRFWIPENIQRAKVHPTDIFVSDEGADEFQYKDYPYKIRNER